jgi:flagellar hook-associated protein 1 FlgK
MVSNVGEINAYAKQIADINNTIAGLTTSTAEPNDLLDKRDQMLTELNKLVKVTVTPGDNNMLNVQFGTGQPLVVGNKAFQLGTSNSPTDASRVTLAMCRQRRLHRAAGPGVHRRPAGRPDGVPRRRHGPRAKFAGPGGGRPGHCLQRPARAGPGRERRPGHQLLQSDQAYVGTNSRNSPASTADVTAVVTDASALTASDYSVDFDGTNFNVTRKSDGKITQINPFPQTTPQVIDGVAYSITGTGAQKDNFLVRPTYNAASSFSVAIKDRDKIALAAPIATAAPTTNAGNGKISAGTVDRTT